MVTYAPALAIGALLVLSSTSLCAQSVERVSGIVRDVRGEPVSGVEVELAPIRPTSGRTAMVTSDGKGTFSLADLPSGDYTLTASLMGYAVVRTALSVGAGGVRDVPLVLAVAHLVNGPYSRIEGVVEDTAGRTLREGVVVFRDLHGTFSHVVRIDPSGRFESEVLDRPYLLVALAPGVAGSTVVPDVRLLTSPIRVTMRVNTLAPEVR
jgi:hypothetical protein